MGKKTQLSLLAGVIFSGAALFFAFRNVPFDDLIQYLASINYLWIIPAIFIVVIGFVLRVIRWQIILGPDWDVPFWQAFHPLMIGFMINCVLPGRAGEVARPIILQQKQGVPFSVGIATVAAERVFDMMLLITIFSLVLSLVEINPDIGVTFGRYHLNRDLLISIGGGMVKLSLAIVCVFILVGMDRVRRHINHLIMKLPAVFIGADSEFKARIASRISEPLVRFCDNFARGLTWVKQPRKLLVCILLSAAIWVLAPLSLYVQAVGSPGITLSFTKMSVVMFVTCFFIALPSVPGYWGLWEAGGIFALSLFGVSEKAAAGFTLASHAVQMLPVMIIGMVSAVVLGINFFRLPMDKDKES